MRKIFAIAVFGAMFFTSCAEKGESEAEKTADAVCSQLKGKITAANFLEAKNTKDSVIENSGWKSDLSDEEFRTKFESVLNQRLQDCFRSANFEKTVGKNAVNTEILGTASKYIAVESQDYKIEITGSESAAFKMYLKLLSKNLSDNVEFASIKGKIILLDNSNDTIGKYEIPHFENIAKLVNSESREEGLTVYLAPIWDSFSDDNFTLAAESLEKINAVRSFLIELNLFDKDGSPIQINKEDIKRLDSELNPLLSNYKLKVDEFASLINNILTNDDLEAMALYPSVYDEALELEKKAFIEKKSFNADEKKVFDSLRLYLKESRKKLQ